MEKRWTGVRPVGLTGGDQFLCICTGVPPHGPALNFSAKLREAIGVGIDRCVCKYDAWIWELSSACLDWYCPGFWFYHTQPIVSEILSKCTLKFAIFLQTCVSASLTFLHILHLCVWYFAFLYFASDFAFCILQFAVCIVSTPSPECMTHMASVLHTALAFSFWRCFRTYLWLTRLRLLLQACAKCRHRMHATPCESPSHLAKCGV